MAGDCRAGSDSFSSTDDYETRTRLNVQDADATLILSHGPLAGGSKLTETVAHSLAATGRSMRRRRR